MKVSLPIVNLETATFRCVYPSCGGLCCRESRPPVSPGEEARMRANLHAALPLLRPAARKVAEKGAWITRRRKAGRPMLAVSERWCVFFNDGCVWHKLGALEGDKNKYKPAVCVTFPLDRDDDGRWYVRQKGTNGEVWELDCLDPKATTERARDSLREEVAFAESIAAGREGWRDEG